MMSPVRSLGTTRPFNVDQVQHPWTKWLLFALALFIASSLCILQLNLLPTNPTITNMKAYLTQISQLTNVQQHRDLLLETAAVGDVAETEAPQVVIPAMYNGSEADDALAAVHSVLHVCSEAYRDAEFDKIEKWGIPPFFSASCDFPRCEDWTVHELLSSFRDRNLTALLKALPCDLWKAIAGRTTWLVGDSQTQYFYRTLRCILREHFLEQEGVQDEPLTTDPAEAAVLKDQVFLHYEGGVGMPICTRLKGNTRVCHVRVNMGYHFSEQYLPQMHLFNASKHDFLVYNTGLWHHKREGQYEDIIRNITQVYLAHKDDLPVMFWRDNSPQHFDIEYGEFPHPDEVGKKLAFPIECKPFENLTIDDASQLHGHSEHVHAGGWRNKLSQPLIDASGMHHIHTWNETALWWRMHTRQENGNIECTHFCGPGPYNLWVFLWLQELQRLQAAGALPPPDFVPVTRWS